MQLELQQEFLEKTLLPPLQLFVLPTLTVNTGGWTLPKPLLSISKCLGRGEIPTPTAQWPEKARPSSHQSSHP